MKVIAVLEDGWKLNTVPCAYDLGVNKLTWQVGDSLWLSRYELDQEALLEREMCLCTQLAEVLAGEIEVPKAIPTVFGASYYRSQGALWRLSQHVHGAFFCKDLLDRFGVEFDFVGEQELALADNLFKRLGALAGP